MKIADLCETRVNSARDRAKRFFNMLSEQRRKAKCEQKELRERQEILREAEQHRYKAIKASLKELKKPSVPPQPSPSEPPEQTEPIKPVSVDPATQDYLRWCRTKETKEEPPPWRIRNTRIYRGAKW